MTLWQQIESIITRDRHLHMTSGKGFVLNISILFFFTKPKIHLQTLKWWQVTFYQILLFLSLLSNVIHAEGRVLNDNPFISCMRVTPLMMFEVTDNQPASPQYHHSVFVIWGLIGLKAHSPPVINDPATAAASQQISGVFLTKYLF